MTEIILHHYEASPYSEKIRVAFGIKGLEDVQAPDVRARVRAFKELVHFEMGAEHAQ